MNKITDFKIGQKVKDSWNGVSIVRDVLKTRVKLQLLQLPENIPDYWQVGDIITYEKMHLQFLTIIEQDERDM